MKMTSLRNDFLSGAWRCGAAFALATFAAAGASCTKHDAPPPSPPAADVNDEDAEVLRFLDQRRGTWKMHNVPYEDGRVLHDLVVDSGSRDILEIGTSVGHSTVWLAWAARKTGGKVITIEVDEDRHREAVANVEAAGLSDYVEFHHADAHELVPQLSGPFDFVFSDADKGWYIQYFESVDPKIRPGGCIAAHNALNAFPGVKRYIRYVKKQPAYETRIDRTSSAGFAISCKKPAP